MLWLEQNKLKSSIIYLSFFWGKKEGGGGVVGVGAARKLRNFHNAKTRKSY